MEEENLIKNSFNKLIDYYSCPLLFTEGNEDQASLVEIKNKTSSLNNFFCNKQCEGKFLKVLKKIQEGNIDLNKLKWNEAEDNFFRNILVQYYNMGLNTVTNKSNVNDT